MEGSRAAKQQAAGEAAVAAASPAAPSPFASAPAPASGGTDGGSSPTAPSAAPEHPPSVGSAPAQVELGSSPGGSPSQEGGPLHAHMCMCMCRRLGTGCAWGSGAGRWHKGSGAWACACQRAVLQLPDQGMSASMSDVCARVSCRRTVAAEPITAWITPCEGTFSGRACCAGPGLRGREDEGLLAGGGEGDRGTMHRLCPTYAQVGA